MASLGERVRQLRLQAGMSQGDLAGSRLSTSYVSLVEAGKRSPTYETMCYLAERLGTSTQELSTGVPAAADEAGQLELNFAKLALGNGDAAQALERLSRLDAAGCRPDLAREVQLVRGRAHEMAGELEQAIAVLEPLLHELIGEGAAVQCLVVANLVAACYLQGADLTRAVEVAEAALERARVADVQGTDEYARLGATLVWALYERGDLLYAGHVLHALIEQVDATGTRRARGSVYWNAALVAEARGSLGEAVHLTQRALFLLGEETDGRDMARLRLHFGWLLLRGQSPDVEGALTQLDLAEGPIREFGSRIDTASWAVERGRALGMLGELDEADATIAEALQLLGEEPRLETCNAWLARAWVADARGDAETAGRSLREAADMLGLVRASRQSASAWRDLGDALRRRGDVEGAFAAYEHALTQGGVAHAYGTSALTVGKGSSSS